MQGFLTTSITYDTEYNTNSVITLYVRHENAAFRICYDPQILAISPLVLKQHHEAYSIIHGDDHPDEYLEVVKRLRTPFEELMTQMARNPKESARDLHMYLYPSWFFSRGKSRKILADTETSPSFLADTPICHLHGLIIDNDEDSLPHWPLDSDEEVCSGTRLVGLLLTYIENKGTLENVAPWSDCTNEDRLRWSTQIQDYVKCLHKAGVVWGDAKPENVLVDMKGDAWVIDFGGGYTQGWVDENKQETVEGDIQGVQRIDEWLRQWSHRPVNRIK
ncbi:hypothetical protein N7488_001109 [Penicillium malachiteum]|nr:hypothetical protein N7488_001109 [Penicillium malachiteum]